MIDRTSLARLSDAALERGLRELGTDLAVPASGPGIGDDAAARALRRIEAGADRPTRRLWPSGARPVRWALIAAVIALAILAAIAGAIGLGLPGIRIVPAPSGLPLGSSATVAPPASVRPGSSASPEFTGPALLGWNLGLGTSVEVARASAAVDFPVALPAASAGTGAPAAAWLLDGRLSLVWPTGPALPATQEAAIGLVLGEFRGSLDSGYFQKIIEPGTTLTVVTVGGTTGYWIAGTPHEIVFVDPSGIPVFDSHRLVGNTLLWAKGDVTYRLESALDRAAAIALAEAIRPEP